MSLSAVISDLLFSGSVKINKMKRSYSLSYKVRREANLYNCKPLK